MTSKHYAAYCRQQLWKRRRARAASCALKALAGLILAAWFALLLSHI